MVIQLGMPEDDLRTDQRSRNGAAPHQGLVAAENVSLRLLLAQAEINARSLIAKAGIDARERDTSERLQGFTIARRRMAGDKSETFQDGIRTSGHNC